MTLQKVRRIGFSISIFALFISIAVSLFYTPFFIDSVGDRQYGIFSFVSSIVSWLSTLTICLGSGYYRFVLREKKRNGEKGEALANGAFQKIFLFADLAIALIGIAIWIFFYFGIIPLPEYNASERQLITSMIFVSVIGILLVIPFTHFTAFPYYKEKYIFTNLIPIITTVFQTGLSFLFLKLGFNVFTILIIHYAVSFGVVLLQYFYAVFCLKQKTQFVLRTKDEREKTKSLIKEIFIFSIFVAVNTLVDIFDKNAGITILGFVDPYDVTIYQLSISFRTYLLTMGAAVSTVFTKEMYDACVTDESDKRMNAVFLKASKIASIIIGLVLCGFLGCGEHFVIAWLGSEKKIVYLFASILLIVWSIPIAYLPATEVRRAKNRHQPSSIVYLLTTLSNFGLSIGLIALLGKDMAIWACIIGTLLTTFIGRWIVLPIMDKRMINLDVKKFFFQATKYLSIGLACGMFVHFMSLSESSENINNWIMTIKEGSIAALMYILLIMCFDHDFIKTIFKRKLK
jgi:O-antigen/teichoic acid export membrane protein